MCLFYKCMCLLDYELIKQSVHVVVANGIIWSFWLLVTVLGLFVRSLVLCCVHQL